MLRTCDRADMKRVTLITFDMAIFIAAPLEAFTVVKFLKKISEIPIVELR